MSPPAAQVSPEDLNFADPDVAGITRRRRGKAWQFIGVDGASITAEKQRARLLAIGLPPAYRDAWYNPDPAGHIQAYGYDARGRRQYRYHQAFRAAQESAKYEGLVAFGNALPKIRAAVTAALASRRVDRDRVLAAVVRLLDSGSIRIGNETYAQQNNSFGATTLRTRHAAVKDESVHLRFRAKGGVDRRMVLRDRALAATIRRCQDLPGQHLFCFEEPDGSVRSISSGDVNEWLRDVAGIPISAKQFRTWWASVIALDCLSGGDARMGDVMQCVATRLGNTPAVARKSYVHPAVVALIGEELPALRPAGPLALSPGERRLMAVIR